MAIDRSLILFLLSRRLR